MYGDNIDDNNDENDQDENDEATVMKCLRATFIDECCSTSFANTKTSPNVYLQMVVE